MSGRPPLRVVVAGGGVAALEATLALNALAPDPISVELIAPEEDFVYRPLAVTEPFGVGETRRFPLAPLVAAAGAALRPGRVGSVDPDRRCVAVDEEEVDYDVLLVALGARPREAVPNAITFSGPESGGELAAVLERAVTGQLHRIVFALPAGVAWPLPIYELALLTSEFLTNRYVEGVELVLVTPEERPLSIFGARASEAIGELLAGRGIDFRADAAPIAFEDGALRVPPREPIEADVVIALARLEGPHLAGLPSDAGGFLPIDDFCRVGDETDVYAAGDATRFPLKQGGIAAQQADVAAADIAMRAGSTVEPSPFRPVLRGLLLTGMSARFLRAEPGTLESSIDTEALWWPPAKIVGRYLAPFLASKLGFAEEVDAARGDRIPVEVELDAYGRT
jgi:sulfide:quinone oxidoreductase